MKFRKYDWLDIKRLAPQYGIQVMRSKREGWLNMAVEGKPLLFEEQKDRDVKLKQLRKDARILVSDRQPYAMPGLKHLVGD